MEPRLVDVLKPYKKCSTRRDAWTVVFHTEPGCVITHAQLPVILGVNFESRSVAKKHYKTLFYGERPGEERIYFNPGLDTLYFPFPNRPFNDFPENYINEESLGWSRRRSIDGFGLGPSARVYTAYTDSRGIREASAGYAEAFRWQSPGLSHHYQDTIDSVLQHATQNIDGVRVAAVDDFQRGTRKIPDDLNNYQTRATRLSTYGLTSTLRGLQHLSFRWGNRRQTIAETQEFSIRHHYEVHLDPRQLELAAAAAAVGCVDGSVSVTNDRNGNRSVLTYDTPVALDDPANFLMDEYSLQLTRDWLAEQDENEGPGNQHSKVVVTLDQVPVYGAHDYISRPQGINQMAGPTNILIFKTNYGFWMFGTEFW